MSQVRNIVKVRYFGHEGQTPRRTTAASFESLRGLHPSAPPRQPRRFLTDCASMCTLVANLVARAHAIALSRFPGVGSAPAQWFSERLVESPRALTVSSPGSAGLSSLFPQGWQQMRPDHDVRHSGGRLGRSDRQLAGQADNGLPDATTPASRSRSRTPSPRTSPDRSPHQQASSNGTRRASGRASR